MKDSKWDGAQRDGPYFDTKGAKGGGKKAGKNKSKTVQRKEDFKKNSNDRRKQGKTMKTPDGRLICMGWQQASGCKYDQCRYVHVCTKCHDKGHGAHACGK